MTKYVQMIRISEKFIKVFICKNKNAVPIKLIFAFVYVISSFPQWKYLAINLYEKASVKF